LEYPNQIKTRICKQFEELNMFAGVPAPNIPLNSIQKMPKLSPNLQVNQPILSTFGPRLNRNLFPTTIIQPNQDISCLSSINFSPC